MFSSPKKGYDNLEEVFIEHCRKADDFFYIYSDLDPEFFRRENVLAGMRRLFADYKKEVNSRVLCDNETNIKKVPEIKNLAKEYPLKIRRREKSFAKISNMKVSDVYFWTNGKNAVEYKKSDSQNLKGIKFEIFDTPIISSRLSKDFIDMWIGYS